MSDPRTRAGGGNRARPRTVVRLFAAVAIALCLSPRTALASDAEWKTAHIVVKGNLPEALVRAYAEMAEAAYPQWKTFFDAEPPKNRLPLELDVRTDRDGFLNAIHAAGVVGALPGAGGYYDPRTRWSFLYSQPHESSTRLLVLHELTHQYQYKALQDDVPDRSPVWHREGLAEHFGYHRRTAVGAGMGVEMGALDMVAIDDRPSQCADRVRAGKFDAWAVGTGTASNADYTDAMTLIETFLRSTDKSLVETYRRWEKEIYKTGNANAKFEKFFQSKKEKLAAAVLEVWGTWKAPWRVGYIAWDEEPGAIVGRGMPWAILVGGSPVPLAHRFIESEIELGKGAAGGGIALGVKDKEHLLLAEIRADGYLLLRRRMDAVWTELARVPLPTAGYATKGIRLRFELTGTTAKLSLDGQQVFAGDLAAAGLTLADVEGAAGLVADSAEVRFRKTSVGRE